MVPEPAHQGQVFLARQQAVHGRELPGEADLAAHLIGQAYDVETSYGDLPAIGADQGGEDVDDGGLSGAVGTEEGEDGSRRDGEVDAVEDLLAAVCLAQPGHGDGRLGACHDSSFCLVFT